MLDKQLLESTGGIELVKIDVNARFLICFYFAGFILSVTQGSTVKLQSWQAYHKKQSFVDISKLSSILLYISGNFIFGPVQLHSSNFKKFGVTLDKPNTILQAAINFNL